MKVDHLSGEVNLVLSCHCYSCGNTLCYTFELSSGMRGTTLAGMLIVKFSSCFLVPLLAQTLETVGFYSTQIVVDDCLSDCDCPIFVEHNL